MTDSRRIPNKTRRFHSFVEDSEQFSVFRTWCRCFSPDNTLALTRGDLEESFKKMFIDSANRGRYKKSNSEFVVVDKFQVIREIQVIRETGKKFSRVFFLLNIMFFIFNQLNKGFISTGCFEWCNHGQETERNNHV